VQSSIGRTCIRVRAWSSNGLVSAMLDKRIDGFIGLLHRDHAVQYRQRFTARRTSAVFIVSSESGLLHWSSMFIHRYTGRNEKAWFPYRLLLQYLFVAFLFPIQIMVKHLRFNWLLLFNDALAFCGFVVMWTCRKSLRNRNNLQEHAEIIKFWL